jgi:hypothetical protein
VTAESNPESSTPFVTFCKCLMWLRSLPQARPKSIKEGHFPKELKANDIEARRPGLVVPRNKTTGEPTASALELLTEFAAFEIERLHLTQVIARDDKGKPTTAIAVLTKKLSDLKGGKAHLERLTGFDGEQKESLFRRRDQVEESEEEAARVATARNSRGKRKRTPNRSSKTTPTHSPQKK